MRNFFEFDKHQTNFKQEIIAGVTTFVTMSYIIIVNPAVLEAAGIPKGPSMVATILSAFFGTLIMGVYAKRPFAIAPYMGENAFIAYTVVKILGYSWQTALGAIFIGGLLFTLLTLCRIRSWLSEAVPESLKYSFAVGIGLFLTFIGLNETGIVSLGVPGAPVKLGDFHNPEILLAISGFLLIGILMMLKVRGSILIGILTIATLSYILKITPLWFNYPVELNSIEKIIYTFTSLFSSPPDIRPILFKLDIAGALSWGFFAVILTVFIMDFVDTMGTLIGVSARAGLLDKNGNLPGIEKPMLADSLATVAGSLLGTTTSGAYIESAAGIEEGGKTGLTAVVVAFLFLSALFLSPVLTAIPDHAYGPALIIVGMLMLKPITKINFEDFSELIPSFITVILMSFTYNIGIGMTAGFILYPLLKIIKRQSGQVHPGLWILCILSILFYIFYPYH